MDAVVPLFHPKMSKKKGEHIRLQNCFVMISIMEGEMQANDDGNHSKGLLTTQAAHIRGGYVAAGVVATLMYCINIGEVTLYLLV